MAARIVDKTTRNLVYTRHGGVCWYCGDPTWLAPWRPGCAPRKQATMDHVRCKVHGGANSPQNYVLACEDCNNERSSHFSATEFFWLKNKDKPLDEVYHRILSTLVSHVQINRVCVPGNGTGLKRWMRAYHEHTNETDT